MNKALNRHNTKKWKKKRKNRHGDTCRKKRCGICHIHKRVGNSKKFANKKDELEKIIDREVRIITSQNE